MLGTVCVWLYPGGAFDEFDYWSGTFALVVFALGETLIFAWIFGMDRGWEEITRGADIEVPRIFRFIIKYVTPAFLTVIFVGAIVKPAGRWGDAVRSVLSGTGWPLAPDSVIGRVLHVGDTQYQWINDHDEFTGDFVQDVTRVLLLIVFLIFTALVWRAWQLKEDRNL